ncbi:MAG: uroporphyrinogen decarboxylase family protein, partial [Actinobacteria bacterium]|nr:uroporphyrinogen decarboxylase family protein [Actinomycetota bacterium]
AYTVETYFSKAMEAHKAVGEDFLLEFDLGLPFFDFFEGAMGFENAIMLFVDSEEKVLQDFFDRYLNMKKKMLYEAVKNTNYEAYFIGCSSSCNSLLGVNLWIRWDKLYLKAMTEEVHKYGKLIHDHNHGKIMQTVKDLAEIGFDCVCPFERFPGDVNGLEDLKAVREILDGKVTFNGNVHTIEALGKKTSEIVIRQVREIKEAFKGTPRLIIGTGDQVLGETPEENLYAMIEEGRK